MNFLDLIEEQTDQPIEYGDMRDKFERYIAWANRNGAEYAYYIMSVPVFIEWHKFCETNGFDLMEYKGKPIYVDKEELILRVFGISGKP